MPRDNNLYVDPPKYKRDGDNGDVTYFATEEEAINELQGPIAFSKFRGSKTNGLQWTKTNRSHRPNSEGESWQKWRCAFHNSSIKCLGECRVVETADGWCYIAFANRDHNDHDGVFKVGVAPQVRASVLDTPSKLEKKLMAIHKRAATMEDADMSTKGKSQLTSLLMRQRKKNRTSHLEPGIDPLSFGAMCSTLDLLKLETVKSANDFNKHSVFLCDTDTVDYIADDDEEKPQITAVVSTENLLLNAFRAKQQGWPLNFHMDASHRYHRDDWLFLMPVTVTSLNQQGHVVAYALVTSDDADTNEFVLRAIKRNVERVVREKQADPSVTHV